MVVLSGLFERLYLLEDANDTGQEATLLCYLPALTRDTSVWKWIRCPGNTVTPGLHAWLKHTHVFGCFAGRPDVQRPDVATEKYFLGTLVPLLGWGAIVPQCGLLVYFLFSILGSNN